jgi:hypothetical protein
LQDSLNVSIINNTIAHNDSLASSGVLTFSIGTPQASALAGNCVRSGPTGANTASCPQPAGVASTRNSTLLTDTFVTAPTCPSGQVGNGCRTFSNPILANNIIWQNRSFQIGISAAGTGPLNQQNLVTLYNSSFGSGVGSPAPAQTATGQCSAGSYWDIGVRGDSGPGSHAGGRTLTPTNSVLTSFTGGYSGNNNSTTAPPVVAQYCNGSRVPPECSVADGCGGPKGFGVPPGISDAVTPNPRFGLTPSATVDEGNNWINVSWGPLSLTNPAAQPTGGNFGGGAFLANYNLTAGIDSIPASVNHPATDFYGNARPEPGESTTTGHFDPGAIEFGSSRGSGGGGVGVLGFTSATNGTLSTILGFRVLTFTIPTPRAAVTSVVTITNSGTGPLAITAETLRINFGGLYSITGETCVAASPLAVGGTCTVSITYATPTTRPILFDIGAQNVGNNGAGTTNGASNLLLMGQ